MGNRSTLKFVAGFASFILLIGLLLLFANKNGQKERVEITYDDVASAQALEANTAEAIAKHPKFHLLQDKPDEIVALTVSPNTTNKELNSLLWYLHYVIRNNRFTEIGLKPTTITNGYPSYKAGMIDIFRRERCARESWINGGSSCGYGEHQDAEYGWLRKDDSEEDDAALVNKDGSRNVVFKFTK